MPVKTHDSDLQKAAAAKIFAQRDRLLRERSALRDEQVKLSVRDREIERELAECQAAAKFFDVVFDPLENDQEIIELRERIRMYRSRAEDFRTRGSSGEASSWLRRAAEFEERLRSLSDQKLAEFGQKSLVLASAEVGADEPAPARQAKVKDAVLNRLREIAPNGERSLALRQYIERVNLLHVHEKTVGMTLYRLSQEGIVHRKGQTWFYGPQAEQVLPAVPENPSAGALGSTHETEIGKDKA